LAFIGVLQLAGLRLIRARLAVWAHCQKLIRNLSFGNSVGVVGLLGFDKGTLKEAETAMCSLEKAFHLRSVATDIHLATIALSFLGYPVPDLGGSFSEPFRNRLSNCRESCGIAWFHAAQSLAQVPGQPRSSF
jgi:hypothetical protein